VSTTRVALTWVDARIDSSVLHSRIDPRVHRRTAATTGRATAPSSADTSVVEARQPATDLRRASRRDDENSHTEEPGELEGH
jgi:hypothetical protein